MSRNKWSKESIIEKILELHQQSVSLNAIAVMENNVKLYGAARTHFGSWQNAINAAGLDYNEINHKIKEVSWSKDIIAAEIQKIANEGGSLRSDYVQKNNTKLHSAAQRYFNYLVNYCFYPVKDAEEIVVSKFLSHGSNREDLKKIYLRS